MDRLTDIGKLGIIQLKEITQKEKVLNLQDIFGKLGIIQLKEITQKEKVLNLQDIFGSQTERSSFTLHSFMENYW